jgi:hypothetical protein
MERLGQEGPIFDCPSRFSIVLWSFAQWLFASMATPANVPPITIRVRCVFLFFAVRWLVRRRWRGRPGSRRCAFPDDLNSEALQVHEHHDGVLELDWNPTSHCHADGPVHIGQQSLVHRKGPAQLPNPHQETIAVAEGRWDSEELDFGLH